MASVGTTENAILYAIHSFDKALSIFFFSFFQALDKLRAGNPMLQSPQPFHQLQQQLLLQAQQNLTSQSPNDFESRRLRMMLAGGGRSMSFGRDGQLTSLGNDGQAGFPVLPRADPEMMLKVRSRFFFLVQL